MVYIFNVRNKRFFIPNTLGDLVYIELKYYRQVHGYITNINSLAYASARCVVLFMSSGKHKFMFNTLSSMLEIGQLNQTTLMVLRTVLCS